MREKKIIWGQPPSNKISLDDCEWYHIMEVPGLGLTKNAEFDCREDITKNIDSLEAWLSDIEYNVDIIERCYPNMHASSIKTLRELAEIRRLFSSSNTNSE